MKFWARICFFALLAVAAGACKRSAKKYSQASEVQRSFRALGVPMQDGCGLGNVELVESERDFAALAFRLGSESQLVRRLGARSIDFTKHALVLLRHGSFVPRPPFRVGNAKLSRGETSILSLDIQVAKPSGPRARVPVTYCLPILIERALVDALAVSIDGLPVFARELRAQPSKPLPAGVRAETIASAFRMVEGFEDAQLTCGVNASRIIERASELAVLRDRFITTARRVEPTPMDQALAQALADASIDFEREALVLLRHSEPTLGPRVNLARAELSAERHQDGGTLAFALEVRQPRPNHGVLMAELSRCYPIVINRSKVGTVVLSVNDRPVFVSEVAAPASNGAEYQNGTPGPEFSLSPPAARSHAER